MLDIKFIRENPEIVKKDLGKRNEKEKLEWLEEGIIPIVKKSPRPHL